MTATPADAPAEDSPALPALPKDAQVVVKLGSAVLTGPDGGLDRGNLRSICQDLARLHHSGRRIIVVTSGAVAAGRQVLGFPLSQRLTIAEKQAAAAAGQARLMQAYADELAPHSIATAQILLARSDMDDRRRYLNVRNCIAELLGRKIIPLLNENDSTTVDELRFGDNDGLAAIVAVSLQADQLWILSDVAGLYTGNPKVDPSASLIPMMQSIPPGLEQDLCGQSAGPGVGSGGMGSKVRAARLATQGGVVTAIAHGRTPGQISKLATGVCTGTWFASTGSTVLGRRSWIAAASASGVVRVDAGARRALELLKRSLLPAGVRGLSGTFDAGDIIEIQDMEGRAFARGLTNYGHEELLKIQGRKTEEIESILGSSPYHEVIHRDNLVVLTLSQEVPNP